MFRVARPRSWLAVLAVAGAVAAAPAARAGYVSEGQHEGTDVVVSDNAFSPPLITAAVGERVWFQLAENAQNEHQLAFDNRPGVAIVRYVPGKPKYQRNYFAHSEAGRYAYYCLLHGGPGGEGMSGVLNIVPPATTTTTLAATTTTTAQPAPAATSTSPAAMTAAGSTSPPGNLVPAGDKATSTGTPSSPAEPSPAVAATSPAPPPASAVSEDAAVDPAGVDLEEGPEMAAGPEEDPVSDTAKQMLVVAVGLFVALLGGAAGWGWHHRPSRWQAA